ncbi:MAG: hypothetical protein HY898_26395 [Deltaproteobacteria bacterium]|nr:hypothetical protein [Deltaproteobacteria bacterium]
MSTEMMIALVCAVSGLLLVVGGYLFGRSGSSGPADSGGESAAELRFKLDQSDAALAEARRQMESERTALEMKIASAKLERDRFSSELDRALKDSKSGVDKSGASDKELAELRERALKAEKERDDAVIKAADLEEKIRRSRPSIPSLEMERDNKQNREEIDRLRTELSRQDARIEGLLANVEKTAAEMEKVVKERDEARERQEAADRIIDAVRARSGGLQQQLKEAQAEIAKLKGG